MGKRRQRGRQKGLREVGFSPVPDFDPNALLVVFQEEGSLWKAFLIDPVDEQDHFHVEIVWSDENTFPHGHLVESPAQAIEKGRGILRFGEIYTPGRWHEHVWKLYEEPDLLSIPVEKWSTGPPPIAETVEAIPGLVEVLMERVKKYGLPFFALVDRAE